MTAEKHPLEMVREALERSLEMEYNPFEPDNQSAHYNKLIKAIATLTTYLCQTQSCAECERLGRENEKFRKLTTWQSIEMAPGNTRVIAASYIEVSEEAYRNGSRNYWAISVAVRIGSTWCGCLGGKPSHFIPLPLTVPNEDITAECIHGIHPNNCIQCGKHADTIAAAGGES